MKPIVGCSDGVAVFRAATRPYHDRTRFEGGGRQQSIVGRERGHTEDLLWLLGAAGVGELEHTLLAPLAAIDDEDGALVRQEEALPIGLPTRL